MKRYALITGILSGLLFGIATPFSKLLMASLNSFQLAGLLYLGAALAMIPSVFKRNSNVKLLFKPGSRIRTLGIIFFGGILGPLLLLAGLKTTNAASVSIWLNMELAATAIIGAFIFKDSLDKFGWIAVILTIFAGIITSIGEGTGSIGSGLLVMLACTCWAIDNHLTAITDGASPQAVTFIKGTVAGMVNVVIGFLLAHQSIIPLNFFYALLVGIFSYGISIVLYVLAAQNIGATRGQILFSTAPVWGVILSYLFFEGTFHWTHIISIILLVMAVFVMNLFSHRHFHTHLAMTHVHYHKHTDGHHDHKHNGDSSIPLPKWHDHLHKHEPMHHEHPHDPDLHHRHEHND